MVPAGTASAVHSSSGLFVTVTQGARRPAGWLGGGRLALKAPLPVPAPTPPSPRGRQVRQAAWPLWKAPGLRCAAGQWVPLPAGKPRSLKTLALLPTCPGLFRSSAPGKRPAHPMWHAGARPRGQGCTGPPGWLSDADRRTRARGWVTTWVGMSGPPLRGSDALARTPDPASQGGRGARRPSPEEGAPDPPSKRLQARGAFEATRVSGGAARPPRPRLWKTPGSNYALRGEASEAATDCCDHWTRDQAGRPVHSKGILTPTPPQGSLTNTDVSEPAGRRRAKVRWARSPAPRPAGSTALVVPTRRSGPGGRCAIRPRAEGQTGFKGTPAARPIWPAVAPGPRGLGPCRDLAFSTATARSSGGGGAHGGCWLPARARAPGTEQPEGWHLELPAPDTGSAH